MSPRVRMRFVGCLLALACGWTAEPAAAQVPGLYKDGVLVEPMPDLVPPAARPQEFGTVRLPNPGSTTSSDVLELRNASRDCTAVIEQVRALLGQVAAAGLAPSADERHELAALRAKVAATATRLEQVLAGNPATDGQDIDTVDLQDEAALVALGMRQRGFERQRQPIKEMREGKEQYLAALDSLLAGHPDALDTVIELTDTLFPQTVDRLPEEPTIRPAAKREALRVDSEQAAALVPSTLPAAAVASPQGPGKGAPGRPKRMPNRKGSGDDHEPQPSPEEVPPVPQDAPLEPQGEPPAPQESPPVPDDLAETPEIQFTAEITAKAAELGGTALPIYEFVRNQVAFQPYLGSRKGAAMTLRQRAGNDADQAALLMALLRASGIPCRYVRGTVDMTPAQAAAWLGVDEPTVAGSILATAGLNGTSMYFNGQLRAIRCTRVWVEAHIPYSNYRGIPNEATGKTWVPLDPAHHGTIITQGADVLTAMGFDTQTYLDDYISTFHAASPLEKLRSDIQSWLDINDPGKTVADIERLIAVDRQDAGMIPGSVGGQLVAVSSRFSTLEDNQRYKVRFRLHNSGSTLIDQTFNLSEIVEHKVTIDYIGATQADQDIIDSYGGIYQTPPSGVNVRPRLKFDGVPVATATASIGMGRTHDSDMQFIHPVGDSNVQPWVENSITAGNTQAIAFNTFFDVNDDFFFGTGSSQMSFLEQQLHSTAADYLARVDRGIDQSGRLMRAVTTQDVSEAIVESSVAVTTSFGNPVTFEWTGLTVDADRRIIGTFPVDGDDSKEVPIMLLAGYDGSIMENRVFEDIYNQEAVSTIKLLALSNDAGIPVYTFTSYPATGLNQSSTIVSAVNSALLDGRHVTIPRDPITVGQWHGTGYINLKPDTGAAGYIISGGINGEVSTNGGATVDVWPINLGCAPIGSITGTITPNGFSNGAVLCADQSQISYSVTLQYNCKDAGGNIQSQTFGPTSHRVPGTRKSIATTYGLGTYTISIPGTPVQPVSFTLVGEVIAIGSRPINFPGVGLIYGHMSMERWVPNCSSAQLDELEAGKQYTNQQLSGAGYSMIGGWELLKNGGDGAPEGGYVVDTCESGIPTGTDSVDISTIHNQSFATELVIVVHQADTESEWTTVSQNATSYGFAEQTGFSGTFLNWPNSRYQNWKPFVSANNSNTFIEWLANASGITFIDPPARINPGNSAPRNLGHPSDSCGRDPYRITTK